MNTIVRQHYPASKLPEDLREGFDADANVTVTVTIEGLEPPKHVMSLEEIFATRSPPYRSAEDIVNSIRQLRDEWHD